MQNREPRGLHQRFGHVEIRRAGIPDVDGIAEAHGDSIRVIGPRFYPPNVVDDWGESLTGSVYARAMEGGEVFFIAIGEIDGQRRVLGFSSHHVEDGRHGSSVYVRGVAERQGIGSALYTLAEEDALGDGATSLHIEASLAGVEFYKSHGFEEVRQGEITLRCGRPIACVFMRKNL